LEIVHRITLNAGEQERTELARMGIDIGMGFVAFDVAESADWWPAVEQWMALRRPSEVVSTTFSDRELAEADWLAIGPSWHHGYPQPEDDFGYLEETYALSAYCAPCGVGRKQIRPFRMRGEPSWGRRGILQLNWVFDEYFVQPDVWSAVFEPLSVASRPVLDMRGQTLITVVQLVIESRVSLDMTGIQPAICSVCGRPKYLPITRGPLPPLLVEPASHIARTTEWFGSGGSAYNEIVGSQELRKALRSHSVRGVEFVPLTHRS
jgi:hypothetical protein